MRGETRNQRRRRKMREKKAQLLEEEADWEALWARHRSLAPSRDRTQKCRGWMGGSLGSPPCTCEMPVDVHTKCWERSRGACSHRRESTELLWYWIFQIKAKLMKHHQTSSQPSAWKHRIALILNISNQYQSWIDEVASSDIQQDVHQSIQSSFTLAATWGGCRGAFSWSVLYEV